MAISEHLKKDVERHTRRDEEKKKNKPSHLKVHHFTVTPATEGKGYSVDTTYQAPMGKGGAIMGGDDYDSRHKTSVHKNLKEVHKHMKGCCGEGDAADENDEGSPPAS